MAGSLYVEPLAPLDLLMPRIYISMLLVFDTTNSTETVAQNLQRGLDRLAAQLPWLGGHVFPALSQGRPSLEIRSTAGSSPTLIVKGSIEASYNIVSSGCPPGAIPADLWPATDVIDDANSQKGVPVFAASLFSFADHGVGLCICLHHNAFDATGSSEVIRLWAQSLTDGANSFSVSPIARYERLSGALRPSLEEISSLSPEVLLARHPEHSKAPPTFPTEFAPCTSKLFRVSLHWVTVLKDLLRKYTSNPPTTNTIVCALIWTTIQRVRMLRNPTLANETSQLITAVSARQRIKKDFSPKENPYLGNVVVYSLSKFPVAVLAESPETPVRYFAEICDHIAHSQSNSVIDSRHVAEIYQLVDQMEDYKSLFAGWDLFGSRDLTITSWADLGLYEMDFGEALGYPKFVRLPYMEADGVVIILPRQRDMPDEKLEVMIMLRKDDMESLESDTMWQTLTSGNK